MTTFTTCPTCDFPHHVLITCPACEVLHTLYIAVRETRLAMDPDHCHILVDGSMYAPSHRAIPGVETLWRQADFDPDHIETLITDIEDWIDAYHTDGFHMGWDEGTLYLYGPNYDELTDEELAEREMGRP